MQQKKLIIFEKNTKSPRFSMNFSRIKECGRKVCIFQLFYYAYVHINSAMTIKILLLHLVCHILFKQEKDFSTDKQDMEIVAYKNRGLKTSKALMYDVLQ